MAINLAFFGLAREPFQPAPDPSFLFRSPGHDEALAQLEYGVTGRRGFILLTGEVGTGKTTLLHALMARLPPDTAVASITHSALSFEGILESILAAFALAAPGRSMAGQLLALQAFLAARHGAGQNTVLILDEAQNLGGETLERIRLLSNFETSSEKILQIVLAGQPELAAQLERPELRQINQRIALRCRTRALTPDETRQYIETRLRVAGASAAIFTEAAVIRIARGARGIPRIINNICDHCLVSAYADQVRRVGEGTALAAIRYFDQRERPRRPGPPILRGLARSMRELVLR
jgi:general secretion pathway protein A